MTTMAGLYKLLVNHGFTIDSAQSARCSSAYHGRNLRNSHVSANVLDIACAMLGEGGAWHPLPVAERFKEFGFDIPVAQVAAMMNHGKSALSADHGAIMKATADVLQLLSSGTASPDNVVEANRQLLLERSRTGVEKYRTTLAASGLSHAQLLQHLLEELLDAANYTQAALCQAPGRKVLAWRYTKEGCYPGAWINQSEDPHEDNSEHATEQGYIIQKAYE